MTFSQRVHESSVQFVEPVRTVWPSRIANLWCMRSGMPGIGFVGTSRLSMRLGSTRGGAKTGGGFSLSTLNASRTATPRFASSTTAPATILAVGCRRSKS
jgi:hypothetical protein